MKKTTSAIIISSLLTACASNPDNLGATSVSTIRYSDYNCKQIGLESDRTERRITELYDNLKKKANNDAWQMGVGLVLLWPTLFLLEGGDGPEATEYRTLKGEYEALQDVSIYKQCGLEFRDFKKEFKEKEAQAQKEIKSKNSVN